MSEPQVKEIYRLVINTGTYRDYHDFTADGCVDSVWFRSYHKYLKKMGGYESIGVLRNHIMTENLNSLYQFTQPSFPNIQSIAGNGANQQDFTQPFVGNEDYTLYNPLETSINYSVTSGVNIPPSTFALVPSQISASTNATVTSNYVHSTDGVNGIAPKMVMDLTPLSVSPDSTIGNLIISNTDIPLVNGDKLIVDDGTSVYETSGITVTGGGGGGTLTPSVSHGFTEANGVYFTIDNGNLLYSTNATNWSLTNLTGLVAQVVFSVCYFKNNYYFTGVTSGQVYKSSDILNWSVVYDDTTPNIQTQAIACNDNVMCLLLGAGSDSRILSTTDSITWVNRYNNAGTVTGQQTLVSLRWCIDRFTFSFGASVMGNRGVGYSVDGISWVNFVNGGLPTAPVFTGSFCLWDGTNYWTTYSSGADAWKICKSSDGNNWTVPTFPNYMYTKNMVHKAGKYLVVNMSIATYQTSSDGINFTNQTASNMLYATTATYNLDKFICASSAPNGNYVNTWNGSVLVNQATLVGGYVVTAPPLTVAVPVKVYKNGQILSYASNLSYTRVNNTLTTTSSEVPFTGSSVQLSITTPNAPYVFSLIGASIIGAVVSGGTDKDAKSANYDVEVSKYGGYGVVRKVMNIIQDGKNTIITAGDINQPTSISGVSFATNTNKDLRINTFNNLALPNTLPAGVELASKMDWVSYGYNFTRIVPLNGYYYGFQADGTFRSTDGGVTWNKITTLPNSQILNIVFIGNFLACGMSGIWRSTDGLTWINSSNDPTLCLFGSIAGSTNDGVLITPDNGVTWHVTTSTGRYNTFACSNNIFVAGTSTGITQSVDGKTWTATNITSGNCTSIVYNNNRFVAGFSTQSNLLTTLITSVDGKTWSGCRFIDSSLVNLPVNQIAFYSTQFIIACNFGLLYSLDGINISYCKDNLGNNIIASVQQTATRNGKYLASGLLDSIDGITWFSVGKTATAVCGGILWLCSNGYSSSDITLIQKTTDPMVDGYVAGEYVWSLDSINLSTGESSVANATYVVAHPSCGNTKTIDDTKEYYVYVRNLAEMTSGNDVPLRWADNTTPATPLSNWLVPMTYGQNINPKATVSLQGNFMNSTVKVSGGVCAVGPFLFAYGNEGLIRNSDANNPSAWFSLTDEASVYRNSGLANDVNVGTSKIVKGMSYRGGNSNYSVLFWSLDSLILASFVGAPAVFNYTIISNAVTILAQNSVIEVYGNYYWIGDNRFFVFAGGQVNEVPNELNRNWFFDNVNPQRQHIIWSSLNPQYNEIWWFFPKGDSYECNWALVYNYIDQVWYDTPINRSAGFYSGIYRHPVWVGNVPNSSYYGYDMWLHEQGTDARDYYGNITPIECNFTTPDIGLLSSSVPATPKQLSELKQNWINLFRFEPDGKLTGTWQIQVLGRTNPRGKIEPVSVIYEMDESTLEVDMQEQWRVMQLQFSSCAVGADWYVGNNLLTLTIGDCEGV